MTVRTIRWGILGTGKIAKAFATALKDTPDAVLAAVASRSVDSATAFATEFGSHELTKSHGSYQALADDPDVDAIYIATPHPMHRENALMCLNGGKHVLVEKAFTVNRREAEDIVALAREKKLFAMEAMWTRFQPAVLEAKRIAASGEIGAVATVQGDLGFFSDAGPEHRLFNPALGGGSLLDLGIYPLSIAAYFLGPVQSVQAVGQLGPTGVDVQCTFALQHEHGGVSACTASLAARTPAEFTVSGSKGFVRLHGRFHNTEELTVELDDGSRRTQRVPRIGNGYAHEIIEVNRCLREGLTESPVMPLDETLALMGVLDDMRRQIGVAYDADR
ncbi:Gfo/Idh/MocA family protein [Pseudoduganella umbonata]|uniref:Gfo/Idh/MocA family oxidoreductase n=1 Tax=Pseudoduganella umbonata TaxID=864828 RepID=A0A4P8HTY3_9BURK|nr:Gfo/Idh/MocA family oxidoreductase [Pseudoduganella umbonata]MBB3220242.1 putative dehydrogenase [Pseudoduganella umbonata]QCP12212.1 Gfo/Idh/MocA family oxidoreductase [Pseudoduganella umbonata]